jgi:hypothetical protein
MTWFYNKEPFTSEMIADYIGFVYQITDNSNGKKYIGKKGLMSKRRLPPLKGMKRRRVKIVETDWQDYYGSSESVKALVEEHGRESFHREIICLCKSKGEMSYWEVYHQIINHVLFKPDEYYNEFIGCKINRKHLLTNKTK